MEAARPNRLSMVPEALNYFGIAFGVVVGTVSLGDVGRRARRRLKGWRCTRRQDGGHGSDEEAGGGDGGGGGRVLNVIMDFGQVVDEWGLKVRTQLSEQWREA
ncbi:hypothetical protein N7508_010071 [Penicillium antarcticum]|uniref:uncharacterized protein n=1 Tax=Penicillium antarcticum TaxID=416450 RepID=UPI002388852E|nr:uncharacterized protein N7508_010071 [Penicillium antarcticum]KAJ5295250.1 hypothetical protein N7508_010071 [Penicillium antarcticum]